MICGKIIAEGEKWTSTLQGVMHVECFKVWKTQEFIKKLQKSIDLLEKSKEEYANRLISVFHTERQEMKLHEMVKKEVVNILQTANFLTKTEVWLVDKTREVYRAPLIDYVLGGKYPSYLSRPYGELPRIDLVAFLNYLKYREPSLLIAIEVSITSFEKDAEKLKNATVFDARVLLTPQKTGYLYDVSVTNPRNFIDTIIETLSEFRGRIKE